MGRLQRRKTDLEKREKRKKIQVDKEQLNVQAEKKSYAPEKVSKKVKPSGDKNSFFNRAVDFVKEAKAELKKVVWPGRNQTIASTIMVIVLVVIISSFLGLVDFLLSGLMALILRS